VLEDVLHVPRKGRVRHFSTWPRALSSASAPVDFRAVVPGVPVLRGFASRRWIATIPRAKRRCPSRAAHSRMRRSRAGSAAVRASTAASMVNGSSTPARRSGSRARWDPG
jgi:hypothetical protein